MLDWTKLIMDGGIFTAVFTGLVLYTAMNKPRVFLTPGEVPPDILAKAKPLSKQEKEQAQKAMFPLMVILVGGTLYSTYTFAQQSGAGFGTLFLHALLIQLIITTFDLIFIDWFILNTLTPKWAVFPGTEGLAGYKDYGFHAKVHLKLLPRQIVGAMVIAGISLLLANFL